MANNENLIPIPGRLHSVATEGHVSGADEIYDDTQQKDQETINSELIAAVGTGGSVDYRISTAVNVAKSEIKGNATSACDTLGKAEALISAEATRAQAAESNLSSGKANKSTTLAGYGISDAYTKSETYTKEEVHNLVTTPSQEYVSVTATSQTTSVTDVLPATGAADTTYRVGNWNGTQYNDSVFSEYAWNGSAYIKLSTKSQIGEVYDISANHAATKYANLAAALGTNGANVPQSLRKGGMSIKFVQSSDNKYVQYRLMLSTFTAAQFTNTANWQGVDNEPTAKSDNLVKSWGTLKGDLLIKAYASLLNYDKQTAQVTMTSDTSKVNTGIYLYHRTYIIKCTSLTSSRIDANAGLYLGDVGTPFVRISPEEFNNGFVTEITIPALQYNRAQLYVRTGTNADIVDIEVYDVTIEKTIPQRIAEYDIEQKIKQSILSEAFAYSNLQYTNGNLSSATIKWFDNIVGSMTITYNADNSVNYIDYTYGTDTYRQSISYTNGSFTSNTISKL